MIKKYRIGDIVETKERVRIDGGTSEYAKAMIYDIVWNETRLQNGTITNPFWQYHILYIGTSPYTDDATNKIADSWIRKLLSGRLEPVKHIKALTWD